MKKLLVSMVACGLMSALAGCATDDATSPDEAEARSAVTVGAWNYVRSCHPLALRTCDNPGACDTGARLTVHSLVFVDGFDSSTKMAHLSAPVGWALADGTDGDPYLSINDGPCL